MKASKPMWIGMLTFVLLVPLAFAQSFAGLGSNPWIYFTVNTVILWFLFATILYLISKSEPGKEKTLIQLGAFGLAAILSWNFVGGSGFIWQVGRFAPIFNLKFIVNTAIIAAILHFLVKWLMGENAPQTESGNIGTGLLVVFFAGILASKMPYYIWEGGSGAAFISLLVGDRGILTLGENRLWLFITTFILSTWILNYWKVSENMPKLTYFFAFIIASRVAHAVKPISGDTMITVAELISAWLIGAGMSKSEGSPGSGKGFVSFIIAFIIVDIIVSTLFPGKGFLFSFSNMTDGFLKGGLIILIAVLGFVFYARAVGRSKAGGFSHAWKDGGAMAWEKFLNMMRTSGLLGRAVGGLDIKDPDRPGELLLSLKRMRLESFVLMSYVQRHNVFSTKKEQLEKNIIPQIESAQNKLPSIENVNFAKIRQEIVQLKEGSDVKIGVANHSLFIEKMLDEIGSLIEEVKRGTGTIPQNREKEIRSFADKEWITKLRSDFTTSLARIDELKEQLRASNALEAYHPLVTDAYGLSGGFRRGYRFVVRSGQVIEVDCRGNSIADINNREMGLGIGRVNHFKKSEISLIDPASRGRFSVIARHTLRDWEYFLADFERLAYHPHSRSVDDYSFLWEAVGGSNSFTDVPFKDPKGKNKTGYDHEALNNPGFFYYRGRTRYDVDSDVDLFSNPENPYPGVSFEGLKTIITGIAKKRARDQSKAEEQLRKIVMLNYGYQPQSPKTEGGR